MNWKYWVIRKMKPNKVKNDTVTAPLAALNRMLRNSRTSSIGLGARRSQPMNVASRAAATTNPATLRPLPQPWEGASMIVKISRAIAAVDSARPGKSRAAASGFFDVGTLTATSAAAAAATGPMAKKMLAQLKCSSSQPPTIGPSAMATPALAPHRPMARARSARPVKTLVISESVAGKIMAAPSPITALAPMSWAGLVVKPPMTLAVPKTASPASSIPLRPARSDSAPEVSSKAAKTRLYASTTHCNWLVVAPSSRTRVGSATLTSVVSRLMAKAASSRAMRIMGLERNMVEIFK